jgi:hypothetical protein
MVVESKGWMIKAYAGIILIFKPVVFPESDVTRVAQYAAYPSVVVAMV